MAPPDRNKKAVAWVSHVVLTDPIRAGILRGSGCTCVKESRLQKEAVVKRYAFRQEDVDAAN